MTSLLDSDSENLREESLASALSERYLAYALSIITARSLPDVRDGLKPVQRRILYGMRALKLTPDSGYKKSARIVGDVMGKFHPHGDKAIYDALARLAQDFSVRYPLVDGQGNFGNLDGDNPAAMRYTEARLDTLAELLLDGLDEDAVDFRTTYDGEQEEPEILPAGFPQLLCNGASGIAVGMATNIPPHNLAEVCNAAVYLIRHPNASLAKLMEFVPGPDFPTGGVICESIGTRAKIYEGGRGSLTVRANWSVERLKGGGWQVVVTGLPYPLKKSRLIEKIATLQDDRKLPFLNEVRDESDQDIRLVLVPKSRQIDPEIFMEGLFQRTDLQMRFGVNINVLTERGRRPQTLGLHGLLRAWLDHRLEVLLRRSRFRLRQIAERLNILAGLRICYQNLEEIIRIIRESDAPKPVLIDRFALNEPQAEAILQMRLRSLSRLRETEIEDEFASLNDEQADLQDLVASSERQWKTVSEQIQQLKRVHGAHPGFGPRRTQISDSVVGEKSEAAIEAALMPSEPLTVVISRQDWVRGLKGHDIDSSRLAFRQDDAPRFQFPIQSQQAILLFCADGRFFTLTADKLPGGKGHGEPLNLLLKQDSDVDLVAALPFEAKDKLLLASSVGRGMVVAATEVTAQTRNGKRVLNLADREQAVHCSVVAGTWLACLNQQNKLLIFPLEEVSEMSRGRGMILQACKGTRFRDAQTFNEDQGPVWVSPEGRRKQLPEWREWTGNRARAGKPLPKGIPKDRGFS